MIVNDINDNNIQYFVNLNHNTEVAALVLLPYAPSITKSAYSSYHLKAFYVGSKI